MSLNARPACSALGPRMRPSIRARPLRLDLVWLLQPSRRTRRQAASTTRRQEVFWVARRLRHRAGAGASVPLRGGAPDRRQRAAAATGAAGDHRDRAGPFDGRPPPVASRKRSPGARALAGRRVGRIPLIDLRTVSVFELEGLELVIAEIEEIPVGTASLAQAVAPVRWLSAIAKRVRTGLNAGDGIDNVRSRRPSASCSSRRARIAGPTICRALGRSLPACWARSSRIRASGTWPPRAGMRSGRSGGDGASSGGAIAGSAC